ncbi:MAG: anaerobic ribonucleoside-triphosphate reductase activating protein [Ruminococcaceae bacterium]|nr:anaerobic ribonucleoside-triphosphate reductase activating protein [Oscillospiraceae bacterium]
MKINGLQKTTLLDFPEKVACTVFTGGCNFRCPFCHNASLVINPSPIEAISEEDFFSYISKRKGVLDGVCITGGEPLLNHDIVNFIKKIRSFGLLIKLDTNGTFPDKLEELLDTKLIDYVAMDIKNSKDKYAITSGIAKFPAEIEKSIDIIINKAPDYEFRTTVVRELHNAQDIVDIATRIKNAKKYFLQCYVDSGDTISQGFSAYSAAEMLEILENARKILPITDLRGI